MDGYVQITLNSLLSSLGEDRVKEILSSFSCNQNKDIEEFLKYKAIEFTKQGIAQTHIVLASYKGDTVVVGYYTLANKTIQVNRSAMPSREWKSRLNRFASYNSDLRSYVLSVPLIAQLGKNFTAGYNKLIKGDELLKLACDKVKEIQLAIGGKMVYVECEDIPRLREFYNHNGFCEFGKRALDRDETDKFQGRYLIQLIKYLR